MNAKEDDHDRERKRGLSQSRERQEAFVEPWWRFHQIQAAVLSGVLLGLGVLLARLRIISEPLALAFYLAAIPPGAFYWAREGLDELINERAVGIEFLMAAAAVGSAILGAWEEAAFLVFLYGSAEAIEEYTSARTRSSIRALLDLAPKTARTLRDHREVEVAATELLPGDRFLVRPGEGIPTDGVIEEGAAALDESPVTGESTPAEKGPGDSVFAGTINRTGALTVRASKRFEDNTLSTIITMVQEAQERKSKTQKFIERFGRRYSPAVLLGALALLVVPTMFGGSFQEWARRAVVLLVAGAPCALVMSTPIAIAAAIGGGGRRGVLIKGGLALEALGRVSVMAFDKTGTITKGEPEVSDVIPTTGHDDSDVLSCAAAVEHCSEHPVARATVREAERRGMRILTATSFKASPGAGAEGTVEGRLVGVGSPRSFEAAGLDLRPVASAIEGLQAQGKTVILVRRNETLLGAIALQDQIRREAQGVVRVLREKRIRLLILTGDNERTAAAVARAVGIDDVHADMKPEQKVRLIDDLRRRHGEVAMVGDGINDAPALAAASVGIAMGAAGTDAAIEAADVALMADDLEKAVYAVLLGRRTRTITRQNIAFSFLVLATMIPAALSGLLTVAVAVLVHEVAELLAVANGLRAWRVPAWPAT